MLTDIPVDNLSFEDDAPLKSFIKERNNFIE